MDLWTWLNANGIAVTTTLTAFIAAGTLVTSWVAVSTLRQAARDSEQRTRPYVIAEFQSAEHNRNAIDLIVRNIGHSLARDVSVSFDPPLPEADPAATFITSSLASRYRGGVATLAPDQRLQNLWLTGEIVPDEPEMVNREPLPNAVSVTISYFGPQARSYCEKFLLHTDTVKMTTVSTSSQSMRGWTSSIADSLKRIATALEAVRRQLAATVDDDG